MDDPQVSGEPAEVEARLRAILSPYLREGARIEDIPKNADLRDFGLDSIGALEFIAEVESQFGTRMNPEEIDLAEMNSIEGITAFIRRRL